MEVKEFRFLSKNDIYNKKWICWSRIYEYEWILSKLQWENNTIHNTVCWFAWLHINFWYELEKYWKVTNSDYHKWDSNRIQNFIKYDIRNPKRKKFDYVLNISTLEHLKPHNTIKAFSNLLNQTNKTLLLTFDYPRVDLKWLEEELWVKCKDVDERLNGINWVVVDDRYHWLNIVVLEISI